MKVILFNAREDEREALASYKEKNKDFELDIHFAELNESNMHLITSDYDAICCSQVKAIPEEAYRLMKEAGIKVFATRSAGFDMYRLDLLKEYGIRFTRVPAYSPNAIAEYAFTGAMYFSRNLDLIANNQAQGDFRWQPSIIATEMRNKTVGILGTGNIGRNAARLFKGAGATVLGYDLYPNKAAEEFLSYVDSVDEILEQCDVISLHMPATDENYHMFNAETFAKVKDNLILVNTARGSLIDTPALLDALKAQKLRAAVIDTYEFEQPYVNKQVDLGAIEDKVFVELLERTDVLYSPHIAFYTHTAIENLVHIALDGAYAILTKGETPEEVKL